MTGRRGDDGIDRVLRRARPGRRPLGAGALGACLGFVLGAPACEPPDRPPARDGDLPALATEFLTPDRISTFQVDEGVVYRSVRSGVEPWSVHLLEVDPTRCEVAFQVVRAPVEEPRVPVTRLARLAGPGAVAAVNGDFFTEESRPIGVEVASGQIRGRASRPVFAWRPGALPRVGRVQWVEESLHVGDWIVASGAPDGATQIVAGFPALLEDGRWVGDLEQADRPSFASQRHPRTAIGWDPVRLRLWIAVVEGRRGQAAEGMTLPELAELMRTLGADDAINLDGGSSSVMVLRGRPVNRSAYPAGERAVVNALVVRSDPSLCPTGKVEDE